jgi:hypothetical protein
MFFPQGVVLENKKGGTKKAKEPLHQSEALLPLIFFILLCWLPTPEVRVTLYQTE